VVIQTTALTIGTPDRGAWLFFAVPAAVLLLVLGLREIRTKRFGLFLFFTTGILVMPALVSVFQHLTAGLRLYPRYFLISHTLFLLLLSYWIGESFTTSRLGKLLCVLALAVFCGGNLLHITRFIRIGRGHYPEAVTYLSKHTKAPVITVTGSYDLRV